MSSVLELPRVKSEPPVIRRGGDLSQGNIGEILLPKSGRWVRPIAGGDGTAPAPVAAIPFVGASHEHSEPMPQIHTAKQLIATTQDSGPIDVPAFGYVRHLFLRVVGTGGTLGAGVLHEDYPFNILQSVTLLDVNGAPIFGPLDGYAMLWTNIQGGYAFVSDPRELPDYVGTINANFTIRVPVEINHYNALGSLANQNSAAAYKLQVVLNTVANCFSTVPTTAPTVTVSGTLEAWTLPNDQDAVGNPQAVMPDNHGTTQFWTAQTRTGIQAGQNNVPLARVGNLIRNVIVIARNVTPIRANNVFPDPGIFMWDARQLFNSPQAHYKALQAERLHNDIGQDNGVFIFSFDHALKNKAGDGPPVMWLPTVQASRIEIQGVSAAAGSWQIITNDVAPVEVVPSERYVQTSRTGYQPQRGVAGVAA